MPPPLKLRGATRLRLAHILHLGWRTATEIGDAFGKPTGSFFSVLTRMVEDGLVEIDTEAPTRGTRYRLTPEGEAAWRTAERELAVPGKLDSGLRLVLIESDQAIGKTQRVLADERISGCVMWAAELHGSWLLAVQGDSFTQQRLKVALEDADVAARMLSVGDVIAGGELRSRASWTLEDVEQRA